MKEKFYLCRRGPVFYLLEAETGKRSSLRTTQRAEAEKLVRARNEAINQPVLGYAMARAYLSACDPTLTERTWETVIAEFCSHGQEQTQALRRRRTKNKAFDLIRHKRLLETNSDDLLRILRSSGVMVAACLHSIHNLAVGMGWLPWPILAPKLWPALRPKAKRSITQEEHEKILTAEKNEERRRYYSLLWEIGASQTDGAMLTAENVDWETRILSYRRQKTGSLACLAIGPRLEGLLRSLPVSGPLFPKMAAIPVNSRSAEFCRRCRVLGIKGVSLHSYRYAWAERAKQCGYAERFAQEALGHNSKAVHRAYARQAKVILPSLESFEKAKVVPVDFQAQQTVEAAGRPDGALAAGTLGW